MYKEIKNSIKEADDIKLRPSEKGTLELYYKESVLLGQEVGTIYTDATGKQYICRWFPSKWLLDPKLKFLVAYAEIKTDYAGVEILPYIVRPRVISVDDIPWEEYRVHK